MIHDESLPKLVFWDNHQTNPPPRRLTPNNKDVCISVSDRKACVNSGEFWYNKWYNFIPQKDWLVAKRYVLSHNQKWWFFSNTYPAASTSNQPQTTKQKPEEVHPRSLTSKVYPWKPWLEQKEDDKIRLPFLGPRYLGSWIFVFRSYFLVELQEGISSLTNQKTLATHTHNNELRHFSVAMDFDELDELEVFFPGFLFLRKSERFGLDVGKVPMFYFQCSQFLGPRSL